MSSRLDPKGAASMASKAPSSKLALKGSSNAAKKKTVSKTKPSTNATIHRRTQVDKKVVEEILLVGSVMATEDPETGELVPVNECVQWLQDLQRVIRRDDDLQRPISLVIGQWKLLPQKLLPLCLYSGRYDRPLLMTLCKILVILTKPVAEHTIRAGKMIISAKKPKKDLDEKIIQEQIWLRENAIQQTNLLVEYKKAFCQAHAQSKPGRGLFSVLVSMLAEPLGKSGRRTDDDHLMIELVLHLFSNLLQAQPLFASGQKHDEALQVHDELVHLMQQELVLDILCVLGAELEHRDNAPYNLLVMELLHHLWKPYHPAAVAQAISNHKGNSTVARTTSSNKPSHQGPSLLGQMQRERKSYSVQAHSRHSHFGGTLQTKKKNQQKVQYVSSSQFAASTIASTATSASSNNQAASDMKRKHKRADVFVPGGTLVARRRQGPSAQRARQVLHTFLKRFCRECYGPVAKSLKGEFRRDSIKIQEGDQVLFLRFIWFVSQWWRLSKQKPDDNTTCIGPLIFTMDIFTFDMVHKSIDSFQQLKQYQKLGPTVAVLAEMMHLLNALYQSKEPTEHVMALGLLDRLYYNSEPLDKLPQLLSKWQPGTTTREHVADLVEVCHVQLKILEANETAVRESDKKGDKVDAAVAKKREAARYFDLNTYIRKRLANVHTVFLYIQLLGQFELNTVTTNHRIVAFLKNRLSKLVVVQPEEDDDDDTEAAGTLPNPTVTLQPLLYQFSMLRVLERILNSSSTMPEDQKKLLVPWATSLVYDFSLAAKRNPLLWVEALLAPSHFVARHCDQITNVYIPEELRMLFVKDQLEQQVARQNEDRPQYQEDDEDEELEFEDVPEFEPKMTRSKALGSKRKVFDDDEEDEEEDKDGADSNDKSPMKPVSKRSKRVIGADDSSDEEEADEDPPQQVSKATRKTLALEESESDSEENVFEGDEEEADQMNSTIDDSVLTKTADSTPQLSSTEPHPTSMDEDMTEETNEEVAESDQKSEEELATAPPNNDESENVEDVAMDHEKEEPAANNDELQGTTEAGARRITVSPATKPMQETETTENKEQESISDSERNGLETQLPKVTATMQH